MSSCRPLLAAGLLLVATSGCGSGIYISRSTCDDGLYEGIASIPCYSSAKRDEALKLIAQVCPNGYYIIEEGTTTVTSTSTNTIKGYTFNRYGSHREYQIKFRERNPPSPTPDPANEVSKSSGVALPPPPALPQILDGVALSPPPELQQPSFPDGALPAIFDLDSQEALKSISVTLPPLPGSPQPPITDSEALQPPQLLPSLSD
jgi:hypothetical protein